MTVRASAKTRAAAPRDFIPRLQRSAGRALTPLQREFSRFLGELGDGWDTFTDFRALPRMDVVDGALRRAGVETKVIPIQSA